MFASHPFGVTEEVATDKQELLQLLSEMGLSERESKVYLTLLSKKAFTVAELQQRALVPRTKIYEVLHKMQARGLCYERRNGRNKYYEAVNPEVALKQMLEAHENELNRKQQIGTSLINRLMPFYNAGKTKEDPLDYIEVLKDKNRIHKRYLTLLNSTRFEMLTFNKAPYSCDTDEKMGEQDKAEKALIERGGVDKGLYERHELEQDEYFLSSILDLKEEGHQARVVEQLPVKMLVFDGRAVMFALDEEDGISDELTMIIIEHRSVASACKILFDTLWLQAEEINLSKPMRRIL